MLEYVTDAQDFGLTSVKGAHVLILCKMEEGKVDWTMTEKTDRLRRGGGGGACTKDCNKSFKLTR